MQPPFLHFLFSVAVMQQRCGVRGVASETPHIVRKAGKKFKKSRKFNVLDLYEIDMGGPYAPSVPCTVHKNDFYSLVWL